jgi:hypothetical protein
VFAAAVGPSEKLGLTGETTDSVQQSDWVIEISAAELLVQSRSPCPASDERHQLALGVGVAVDVSLSRLDRAVTG